MVSKYRDILEPPAAEVQLQRSSPVMQRSTPTQGTFEKEGRRTRGSDENLYFTRESPLRIIFKRTAIKYIGSKLELLLLDLLLCVFPVVTEG